MKNFDNGPNFSNVRNNKTKKISQRVPHKNGKLYVCLSNDNNEIKNVSIKSLTSNTLVRSIFGHL